MRTTALLVLACLLTPVLAQADDPAPRDRHEFAAKLARLTKGTPIAEVEALLGAPDDVRDRQKDGGIHTTHTKRIWRYGTKGHLSFASLGLVYVDDKEQVQYVFGGTPPALPKGAMDEDALDAVLRLIDRLPSASQGDVFNPRHVIAAVNALVPLGKERAVQVMREYARLASPWTSTGREGLFFVVRCLFGVPPGGIQPMPALGLPFPPAPTNRSAFPRFPMALRHDVPFALVSGYMLAGKAERIEDHLDRLERFGAFRTTPLQPKREGLEQAVARLLADATDPSPHPNKQAQSAMRRRMIIRQARMWLGLEPIRWDLLMPGKPSAARPTANLRMTATVPRAIESGCRMPVSIRFDPMDESVRLSTFLWPASVEVELTSSAGKVVRVRPADPTEGMPTIDDGSQYWPRKGREDARLETDVPISVKSRPLRPGEYTVRVRYKAPGYGNWHDRDASLWKREGFWTGTLTTEPVPLTITQAQGIFVNLRVPTRLRVKDDLAIYALEQDAVDERVHLRNGAHLGTRYTIDGEERMLTSGPPDLRGVNAIMALRTEPPKAAKIQIEIEVFETGDRPVHLWMPSPRDPTYKTLWRQTFAVHLTVDQLRRLERR